GFPFSAHLNVRGRRLVTYCSLGSLSGSPFTSRTRSRSLWLKNPTLTSAGGSDRFSSAGTRNCSTSFPFAPASFFESVLGGSFLGAGSSGSNCSPGPGNLSLGIRGASLSFASPSFGLVPFFDFSPGLGGGGVSSTSFTPTPGLGTNGGGSGGSGFGAGAPQ